MAQWTHFDSIPNSIVKRCSGEDSEDVGPCQNSSMPGPIYQKPSRFFYPGGFLMLKFIWKVFNEGLEFSGRARFPKRPELILFLDSRRFLLFPRGYYAESGGRPLRWLFG